MSCDQKFKVNGVWTNLITIGLNIQERSITFAKSAQNVFITGLRMLHCRRFFFALPKLPINGLRKNKIVLL